jgi:hypothetical protein
MFNQISYVDDAQKLKLLKKLVFFYKPYCSRSELLNAIARLDTIDPKDLFT